ncbi:hypothetical protein ACFU99_11095 [Streptomyces sp. NPDC057654]|uniref:hypothetical protein n=1 Tax=Streptomyces sp. NPDC057654 TaxID=3346196 RepID=UPI0036A8BD19
MKIELLQEAGEQYDELGWRIKETAEKVIPVVKSTTGLPLPHRPVMRLVTKEAWSAEYTAFQIGVWNRGRGKANESLDHANFVKVRQALTDRLGKILEEWHLRFAQCIETPMLQPELLILPESLHRAGADQDSGRLSQMLAHEITHLAQYWASEGRSFDFFHSHFREVLNIDGMIDFSLLLEGHASWAQYQVTRELLGSEADRVTGEMPAYICQSASSSEYERTRARSAYTARRDFVEYVITEVGTHGFNALWKHSALYPLDRELRLPNLYLLRVEEIFDLRSGRFIPTEAETEERINRRTRINDVDLSRLSGAKRYMDKPGSTNI